MKKHEAIAPDLAERIVIVGGGFAGVTLAQRLERLLPEQTEIIVLGTNNHLVFTPMLRSGGANHFSSTRRRGGPPVDPAHKMAGGARQPD